MDCSPPGPSLHGILQARILEWVATSFSKGPSELGTEPRSPALQAESLPSEPPRKPPNGPGTCFQMVWFLVHGSIAFSRAGETI